MDTGSSTIVSYAAKTMIKSFSKMTANTGFVIEGRKKCELPERMLCIQQYKKVFIDQIKIEYDYTPPEEERRRSSSSSWSVSSFFSSSSR